MPIKDSKFLNDVITLDQNSLLISDTGNRKIYKVDLNSKTYSTFLQINSQFSKVRGFLDDIAMNENDELLVSS